MRVGGVRVTEIDVVSSEWLALREPEDARARSRDLALAAAAMLPRGPIAVHDLGSGTGSMMRWLAPLLPAQQTWVLHDWNAGLIDRAMGNPPPLDRENAPVSVYSRPGDLSDLHPEGLSGASLVTASALLDVLTSREVHTIIDACVSVGCPALFTLSVSGKVHLSPRHPLDDAIERAFNAHQLRERHGRRQLGPYAAPIARGLFREAGWRVRPSTTSWRLDQRQPRLLGEWLDGWIDAAVEQDRALRPEAGRYRRLRTTQQQNGELTALIRHVDMLAWPR